MRTDSRVKIPIGWNVNARLYIFLCIHLWCYIDRKLCINQILKAIERQIALRVSSRMVCGVLRLVCIQETFVSRTSDGKN